MDSVTQFALGAGVGLAVLGPSIGPRRAAAVGGILGTLPDLDVFLPHGDPVDAFVQHRAGSHSLIVHAAATPLLGEALMRLVRGQRGRRLLSYSAVFLCLTTHALLDAMTVYGTRIFWPLWTEPIAVGSIFIIDPLYTLPLLVALAWATCLRQWTPRLRTVITVSLAVSTLYLGWSVAAQQVVHARAARILQDAGIRAERVLATPTPFNTLFWRVIAIQPEQYFNLYLRVYGTGTPQLYRHPRHGSFSACLTDNAAFDRLARFSRGYFSLAVVDRTVVFSDVRMGLPPNYAFQFAIAQQGPDGLHTVPPRRVVGARQSPGDLDWLLANLAAGHAVRTAEAAAMVRLDEGAASAPRGDEALSC